MGRNCSNCRYDDRGEDICIECGDFTKWTPRAIEENEQVKLLTNSKYQSLLNVLEEALSQASCGKGKDRHADNQPFEEQPIIWIEKHFHSYQLGQAVKKIHESQRLDTDAAIRELLGSINYLAAKIITLKAKNTHKTCEDGPETTQGERAMVRAI